MEFDEAGFTFGIDQAESVDTKALHGAQAFRDRAVGHGPQHHVCRFRHQRDEVPEGVVRRAASRDFVVRFRFYRVHEVGKLDRVLNKEDRHVVAHQVEVAFAGVELDRKTTHIAHGIARATWPLNRRETHENRRFLGRITQKTRLAECAVVFIRLEIAMGCGAAGVNNTLRDTLMVKVRDFFTHDEVFKQRRSTAADFKGVLVIGDFYAVVGAQRLAGGVRAKLLEALQLGVGVAAVRCISAGHLAF